MLLHLFRKDGKLPHSPDNTAANSDLHTVADNWNTCLTRERDSRDKLSRELQRLKEHLLLVEETSTAEAVEAEKRETELREQIRRLQSSVVAADTDAAKTTQFMKVSGSLYSLLQNLRYFKSSTFSKLGSALSFILMALLWKRCIFMTTSWQESCGFQLQRVVLGPSSSEEKYWL